MGIKHQHIQEIIKGDLDLSDSTLDRYSRDASIFEVKPAAVVYPKNIYDLKALIKYASDQTIEGNSVTLTPRNGGTCMSGGSLTRGIVLDMSRYFNNIDKVDVHKRKVVVQGGVMHKEIEEATHPLGLFFAPYTSSHKICGIGGMIGNNASGEKSIRFGATNNNIDQLKVVLSDGNEYEFGPLTPEHLEAKKQQNDFEGGLYRSVTELIDQHAELIERRRPKTVKNAAGYALWELWNKNKTEFNMARLFIGAQGTLGIVSQATLNLEKILPFSRMLVVPIEDLDELSKVVNKILEFNPAACETFDYHTYELAKKYHPLEAKRAYLADGKHMVIIALFEDDNERTNDTNATNAQAALKTIGHTASFVNDPKDIEAFLDIRRWSFKMLLEHPEPNTRAMAFLEDTIVPIERYGAFLPKLESILEEYNLIYTYAGHIAAGSIRLIPLMNMEENGAAELVMELESRVNDLVLELNGSISVDHNDGIIRTPFLEKQFGPEMIKLFKQVKTIFDPLGIFNPGKKVNGTYEYALEHIIRRNK